MNAIQVQNQMSVAVPIVGMVLSASMYLPVFQLKEPAVDAMTEVRAMV